MITWLAACHAPPELRAIELDLGGPATALRYDDDGALVLVAEGALWRVPPGSDAPTSLPVGEIEDAVPVRRTGEIVVHSTAGRVSLFGRDGVERVGASNLFDVDGLVASEHGEIVAWNDQFLHVHLLETDTGVLWQLLFDGHLLALTPDAQMALIADGMWLNWYLVYLDPFAHAVPVRYPAGDLVDLTIVGRDPRYAEVLPADGARWMVVADGDGNVPIAAVTAGAWREGAITDDGAAVITLEQADGEWVLARYTAADEVAEELARGRWTGQTQGLASATPDGRALAVSTATGATIFLAP